MKLSRYNFLKQYGDSVIFFNAMTCALAIVDENFLRAYEEIKLGQFDESKYDPQLISDMKMSGCLISDETDELKLIEFYRNQAKYDSSSLGLTVAPTLACNFRCKYCFEHHDKGFMSKDIQDALIIFAEEHLQTAKNFFVTWYGGEPLLARNIIWDLSERFLELCGKHNVEYSAYIVTNASLMTDEDLETFNKYKIAGAQLTIDGPKEIHDRRRISVNGRSTFDTLIQNANKLLNNDFDVVIRVNVDKENIDHVPELLRILRERIERYDKIKIDFGQVTAFTEVCRSIESSCYDSEQYADVMLPLYDKVIALGFAMNKMNVYPSVRFNYCCADYINSFVIDMDGCIYKCWNHVGIPEARCGRVNELSTEPSSNFLKWIQNDPLSNRKCRDCKMLPICMGGCPDLTRKSNHPACDTIKFNLDKVVNFYYEKLRGDVS